MPWIPEPAEIVVEKAPLTNGTIDGAYALDLLNLIRRSQGSTAPLGYALSFV